MTDDDTMPRRMPPRFDDGEEAGFPEEIAPAEEFYDDSAYVEGEENLTHDWQDYEGEGEDAGEELQPPEKKSKFNIIVIGLAALLGLFFLYSAVAGHRGVTHITASNLENAGQLPGTGPAKISAPLQENTGQPNAGLLNDQTALDGLPGKIDNANNAAAAAGAQPEPQAQPQPMAAAPAPMATPPADASAASPAQPVTANSFLKADAQAPAATPPPAAPLAAQPVAAQPVAAQPSGAVTSDPRIDQLLERLNADEEKLNTLPKAGAGDADALARMGERLDKMEQVQAQLLTQMQSIAQNAAPAAQAGSPAQTMTPMPAGVTAAQPSPVAAPPRHARSTPRRTARAENSAATWILKSAQPGEAYVSAPDSDAMIAVHPGDNFPGLGRVVSIGQANGQWIVRGTQGSITQQ